MPASTFAIAGCEASKPCPAIRCAAVIAATRRLRVATTPAWHKIRPIRLIGALRPRGARGARELGRALADFHNVERQRGQRFGHSLTCSKTHKNRRFCGLLAPAIIGIIEPSTTLIIEPSTILIIEPSTTLIIEPSTTLNYRTLDDPDYRTLDDPDYPTLDDPASRTPHAPPFSHPQQPS